MPIDLTNTAITVTPLGDTLDTRYPAGVVPPPVDESGSYAFAFVPEHWFVEGYEETKQLGWLHLDDNNLPATNQQWWLAPLPHGGPLRKADGTPWVPSSALTLTVVSGSLPAGLAFNTVTGALRFDGRFGSPGSCTVKLVDALGNESNVFSLRVVRPTLVFGYGAETVAAQFAGVRAWADPAISGQAFKDIIEPAVISPGDDDDNVILYLAGNYTSRTACAPTANLARNGTTAVYLCGQPTDLPRWLGLLDDDSVDPPETKRGPVFQAAKFRISNFDNSRSAPDRNNALTMGFQVAQTDWSYPDGVTTDMDILAHKIATYGTREVGDDAYAPVGLEYNNTTVCEFPLVAQSAGGKVLLALSNEDSAGQWKTNSAIQLTGFSGGYAALNGTVKKATVSTTIRTNNLGAWQSLMSTATAAVACSTHDATYAGVMAREWGRGSVTIANAAGGVTATFGTFSVDVDPPRPFADIKAAIAIVDEVSGKLLYQFALGFTNTEMAALTVGGSFTVAPKAITAALLELQDTNPAGYAANASLAAGVSIQNFQYPGTFQMVLHDVVGEQCGAGGQKHYFYMHGQPNGVLYTIGASVEGGGSGGVHIKSTSAEIYHWHVHGSPIINPLSPDLSQLGFADKALEIGAVSYGVVFNADIYMTKWPQGGAGGVSGSTIGIWNSARASVAAQNTDWPGAEIQRLQDEEPSGDPDHWLTNVHPGLMGYRSPYSGGWETRGRTWGNPDFWLEGRAWPHGAPSRPQTVPKFGAHIRWHWIDPSGKAGKQRNPIQMEGSFPLQSGGFSTSNGRMEYCVPRTWFETVAFFGHDCSFNGWPLSLIWDQDSGLAINDPTLNNNIVTTWGKQEGGLFWTRGRNLPEVDRRGSINFTTALEATPGDAQSCRTVPADRPGWFPVSTERTHLRVPTAVLEWANAAAPDDELAVGFVTRSANWIDSATRFHYDWMRERFRVIGQAAGQSLTWVADYLTDAASWSEGTAQITGNAGGVMHECATYDPITGDQYLLESAGATLRIHRRADGAVANAWTVMGDGQLPSVLGGNSDILESSVAFGTSGVAMAYTPHLTGCNEPGLVIVCTWGVLGYSLVSNTWIAIVTRSAWTSAAGGASNGSQRPWAVYNTATNAVILGNGRTSGGTIWKVALTASGPLASTLATGVTLHLGPDAGSGQCVKVIDDPYRRARLYGLEFGPANTPNLYTISPLTGAIDNVGTHPFDPDDAQNEAVLVCAAHGLRSIAALVSSTGQLQLKLWRIA